MNYQETLQTALELQSTGGDIEDLLSQVPDWRPEFEADLRLAALAKDQLSKVAPRQASTDRAAAQLKRTVQELGQGSGVGRSVLLFGRRFRAPFGQVFAAGLTAAVLVVVGLVALLPDSASPANTTAEAVVIEGTVFEISEAGLLLTSGTLQETVLIVEGAVLRDSLGNIVSTAQLKPGQTVVLTGNHSNGEFLASKVEFKSRLFGTVLNVDAERISLVIGETEFSVVISPDTRVRGVLVAGVFVEIEVGELEDGTLFAKEIEVEEPGDDGAGSGGNSGTSEVNEGTITPEPGSTPEQEETKEPEETPTPQETQEPDERPRPEETKGPEETPTPEGTEGPEETPTPEGTEGPEETPTPGETEVPTPTEDPD